jgi:hypothetical protein
VSCNSAARAHGSGWQTDQFANLSITALGVGVIGSMAQRLVSSPKLEILKSRFGFSISIQSLPENTAPSSIGIYDLSERLLERFTGIRDNRVFWDVSGGNFAEGLYIVKVEFPGKIMIDRALMFSRCLHYTLNRIDSMSPSLTM